MWWKRRKIQGLLAASLYEPLTADEQKQLDRALAESPGLRADADVLRQLVETVPDQSPELNVDLLPSLHERLANDAIGRSRPAGGRALVWASVCALTFLAGGALLFWTNQASAPGAPSNAGVTSSTQPTLLAQAIIEADLLVGERKPVVAYDMLVAGVKAQPDDPLVAEAQVRIADLAFDLELYAQSLEVHNLLVAQPYSRVLDDSPVLKKRIVQRRDLLAEAAARDFKPLYDLNLAMQDRGKELETLERVIGDYPQLLVADLAAENMGHFLADETEYSDTRVAYLEGMKAARARCSDPSAIALLDLKIGDLYRDDFNNIPAAVTQYRRASENPIFAKRAGDALGSLPQVTR
jgi:hypothetical protein